MNFRLLFLLLFFSYSPIRAQDTTRILFIGNSLTYFNNLPEIVVRNAKENGHEIVVEMIAKANYAIIDHWNEGEIQKTIRKGSFKYVIVQQGPSSQPEGRKILIDDGKRLADYCTRYNTKLCFFMVWPSLNYYSSFEGVIKSHKIAAETSDAILIPVGEVWKKHFDETGKYDYYGPDGFHPSQRGSEVAAEVIVNVLFNEQ